MPRYIDTGNQKPKQDVGHWLDENVVAGIRGFRCQFGYFRFEAIRPFANVIHNVADLNDPVHLVLGSNAGSLIAQDAQLALRVADGRDASLTIVSFADAEFHPKTIHIVRADGSSTAVVGSSNLTGRGLGKNIEASVILDSNKDDPAVLQAIAEAIDRWHLLDEEKLKEEGAYWINSDADIQDLANQGVINAPQPVRRVGGTRGSASISTLTRRQATWTPSREGWRPTVPALIPRPAEIDIVAPIVEPSSEPEGPPSATAIVLRWCKKLDGSDAQRVQGNATGKLRLAKANFPIDKNTWFRHDFFNTPWQSRKRQGNKLDVTTVRFDIRVNGRSMGQQDLIVDHGEHRIANQANVPTVLAWGTELNQELRDHNHVGNWVVLTRDVNGRFALTIQRNRPHWAPTGR